MGGGVRNVEQKKFYEIYYNFFKNDRFSEVISESSPNGVVISKRFLGLVSTRDYRVE